MTSLSVAILALPGVQLLDVAGPLDVFAEANLQAGYNAYTLTVLTVGGETIATSSGTKLLADQVIAPNSCGRFDTLLIAGAPRMHETTFGDDLMTWLTQTIEHCRRYGSVCSGAFLLGQAGLLDGRRATTHWAVADLLAARHPYARIEADALHVFDGPLRTAAGVTSGLDLALALVEEDLGQEIARQVAGQLVMFFKRGGGQAQFSRRGVSRPMGRAALQQVQRWIAAHPAEDHSIENLAVRAGISSRHFARLFKSETGLTPAAFVENVRIDAVRQCLEDSHLALKQTAALCGFRDVDTMRRSFMRQVGITPAEYRKRHVPF